MGESVQISAKEEVREVRGQNYESSESDSPVSGDYDGDGKHDAGVFRSSNSTWYIQRTTAGTLIQQFGITGDLPLPNAYVR